jgi:hypothetical protein
MKGLLYSSVDIIMTPALLWTDKTLPWPAESRPDLTWPDRRAPSVDVFRSVQPDGAAHRILLDEMAAWNRCPCIVSHVSCTRGYAIHQERIRMLIFLWPISICNSMRRIRFSLYLIGRYSPYSIPYCIIGAPVSYCIMDSVYIFSQCDINGVADQRRKASKTGSSRALARATPLPTFWFCVQLFFRLINQLHVDRFLQYKIDHYLAWVSI